MLRGEWERVGKEVGGEVGEGKEWQMKGSQGRGLEEVGVGRGGRGGEGVRGRGRDEIGRRVGRKGN